MKPAPFAYRRPASLHEASALLGAEDEARIIAGGQTLIPMLAMRLARPSTLVDIARIPDLDRIAEEPGAVAVGAMARQASVERSALVAAKAPLLAAATLWVGHPPIRTRGTIGGSIANADPSAEIALVAATLEATMTAYRLAGRTTFAAREFFLDAMTTALPADAILEIIRFPIWEGTRIGVAFEEASVRRGDFALAAAAAQVRLDDDGHCLNAAVGVGGVGARPIRLDRASQSLIGSRLDAQAIASACSDEIDEIDALSDRHASAAYRRRAGKALALRALARARENALRAQR